MPIKSKVFLHTLFYCTLLMAKMEICIMRHLISILKIVFHTYSSVVAKKIKVFWDPPRLSLILYLLEGAKWSKLLIKMTDLMPLSTLKTSIKQKHHSDNILDILDWILKLAKVQCWITFNFDFQNQEHFQLSFRSKATFSFFSSGYFIPIFQARCCLIDIEGSLKVNNSFVTRYCWWGMVIGSRSSRIFASLTLPLLWDTEDQL